MISVTAGKFEGGSELDSSEGMRLYQETRHPVREDSACTFECQQGFMNSNQVLLNRGSECLLLYLEVFQLQCCCCLYTDFPTKSDDEAGYVLVTRMVHSKLTAFQIHQLMVSLVVDLFESLVARAIQCRGFEIIAPADLL